MADPHELLTARFTPGESPAHKAMRESFSGMFDGFSTADGATAPALTPGDLFNALTPPDLPPETRQYIDGGGGHTWLTFAELDAISWVGLPNVQIIGRAYTVFEPDDVPTILASMKTGAGRRRWHNVPVTMTMLPEAWALYSAEVAKDAEGRPYPWVIGDPTND